MALLSMRLWVLLLIAAGCAAPARSTRFTDADFSEIASAMAQSLYASDAIQNRTPDSPLWVVSIDKVTNLTSDVITVPEQWAIMARIIGAAPLEELDRVKNIRFVIPPERALALRDRGIDDEVDLAYGSRREVNHTMTATFRSVTRANPTARTDVYLCVFELLDLDTGQLVWSGSYEIKRSAVGKVWD